MKIPIVSILFILLFDISVLAQFNNIYLTENGSLGGAISISENINTGQYYLPVLYGNSELENQNWGFLSVSQSGNFNSLHEFGIMPPEGVYASSRAFFRTQNNDFIYAAGINGPFLLRLNSDFETIWSVVDNSGSPNNYSGGVELSNGDLVLSLFETGTPFNILKMRRYSSDGDFQSSFNVTLDYDYSYPSSIIAQDSLIYISFPRYLSNNFRRNYVACYNAITGEEIWESHLIENGEALGYTDGFLCMGTEGILKLVYVEQNELAWPSEFISGYEGKVRVLDINTSTGEFLTQYSLSEQLNSIYIVDVSRTDDGGMALLLYAPYLNQQYPYSYAIMKVSEAMEVEWRVNYEAPTYETNNTDISSLSRIIATSDNCLAAVGSASGTTKSDNIFYQYPWVLKVDACGNEMVTDCALSGVGDLASNNTIAIYPNPARDRIYLKGKDPIKHVSIFDLQGKMVHDESFSGSLEQTLFIDHLPPGLYLVQATNQTGAISTNKISVKR